MTYKKRAIKNKALALLQQFPALVILGARQTGKTSLAKNIAKNWRYIDLEKPSHYDMVSHDPEFFFEQTPNSVILDEAQEYPQIFNILRGVIDEDRTKKGRFILTGSSHPELLHHVSESLAGRVAIIELGTFKHSERENKTLSNFYSLFNKKINKDTLNNLKITAISTSIMNTWLTGGYPEPCLNKDMSFQTNWMENYYQTYISRDIAKLFPKLNHTNYRRFTTILAQLSGTMINKSQIARALDISEKTIRDYLDIANGTYIWRNIPSYKKSVSKSIVKMSKGYIRDSGLLHYLLKINTTEALYSHPNIGNMFEGFIIEELLKGLEASPINNWNASYYRTRGGAEIDLILDGPFGVLPIEIKYGSTIKRAKLKTLETFVSNNKLEYGILINNSKKIEWLTPSVLQLPATFI